MNMKKFLTSIAAVAMAFSAGAADWNYTVDPAEGEVTMLQFVTLTFPNIDEIEINSLDDLTVTRNGGRVRGVDASVENDNELHFVFGAEQTEPATYIITIPAGALAGYADNFEWMEDNEEIVLTYKIASQGGDGLNWEYMVNPEPGEVTEISEIVMMFPHIEEVEINSKDEIVLEHNGVAIENVAKDNIDETTFSFTPAEPLTASGTYTLSIPAHAIAGYDFSNEIMEDNPEDIILTWTIQGAPEELSFEYKSSLPEDEYLAYFGELTLEFTEVESVTYSGSGITVKKNGEPLEDVKVSTDANKLTLTLKEALNFVEAKIEVEIAPDALTAVSGDVTASNKEAIKIAYTMATPVEYDLSLAISAPKPNADGQIDFDRSVESLFFVCEQKGLVATDGTATNVTIRSEEGDFEASGHLRKANGVNANYTYFSASFGKEPSYNGTYIVTIEKGAFGTAVWGEDPNYGHSNDKIELKFEIVGGPDRASYSIVPTSIDPAEGTYVNGKMISEITLSFADGVEMVAGASATLAGVDNSYRQTASFTANPDGGYKVTFPVATDNGKYLFTVAAGQFGDSGFVSNGIGKGSAPISISYTVNSSSGVVEISGVEADSDIYNLQGIRMNSGADNLPAGLYIINGKKIVIKK